MLLRMKQLLVLALFAAACSTARPPVDACSLLTPSEVQQLEGEATKETKSSAAEAGALAATQCFYALPTFAKSFTVTVMAGSGHQLEEQWEQLFEERHEQREEEKEGEEVERSGVEHIPGLGRDARWSVSRYAGVLHVRTSHAIVRITTGSTGDEADRLNRARKIARIVIGKL